MKWLPPLQGRVAGEPSRVASCAESLKVEYRRPTAGTPTRARSGNRDTPVSPTARALSTRDIRRHHVVEGAQVDAAAAAGQARNHVGEANAPAHGTRGVDVPCVDGLRDGLVEADQRDHDLRVRGRERLGRGARERALRRDRVDRRPGERKQRVAPAQQGKVVEAADRLALGGRLVAREHRVNLGLDDLVAALVGHAEHEARHAVARRDDGHLREEHARGRTGELGEHEARDDRQAEQPDERLGCDQDVSAQGPRRPLAVPDGRQRLDAEEERIDERAGTGVLDAVAAREIREREKRVDPYVERREGREQPRPRAREQEEVGILRPTDARGTHDDAVEQRPGGRGAVRHARRVSRGAEGVKPPCAGAGGGARGRGRRARSRRAPPSGARRRAAAATTSPKVVPANTIPAAGSASAHGWGPSEIPKAARPTAKSTASCATPTRKRASSFATRTVANGAGIARRRSSVPQSRSSSNPSDTPSSMPRRRKVTLKPGTFWSKVLSWAGAPVTLVSAMRSAPGSRAAGSAGGAGSSSLGSAGAGGSATCGTGAVGRARRRSPSGSAASAASAGGTSGGAGGAGRRSA